MSELTVYITSSDDDAHDSGGAVVTNDNWLVCGGNTAGLRFLDVAIPQGSTINSAYLHVEGHYRDDVPILTKVYCVDADTCAAWTTTKPSAATKTTAAVDWDFATFAWNGKYTSPDLASCVAEVISRVGWASGNDLGVIMADDSSSHYCNFHQYGTYTSYIVIDYTVPATGKPTHFCHYASLRR